MDNIKKIAIYMLIGCLTVSSTFICYNRSVHAIDWVQTGISTAEALKWLLGALGVVGTVGAAGENFWEGYEEEYYEFVDENYDSPGINVRDWLENLSKGVLDKSSVCWDAFKAWAASLVSSNSGSIASLSNNSIYNYCADTIGLPQVTFNDNSTFVSPVAFMCSYPRNKSAMYLQIFYETGSYSLTLIGSTYYAEVNNSTIHNGTYLFQNGSSSSVTLNDGLNYYSVQNNSGYSLIYYNVDVPTNNSFTECIEAQIGTSSSSGLDTIDDARQEQFDLISSLSGDEEDLEVSIPMPGVSSGSDTISQDIYDGIIDRINEGIISLDDGIAEIQDLLKVVVYDTVTDDVIPISPDPNSGDNKKKDDVIRENKDNMSFTLGGLETVFPFCIPWDLYALIGLLVAEPVAPNFEFPFRNPDTGQDMMYKVDLSVFDDVAEVVRYGFDFAFIVGLALVTRKMIGAGGD